MRVLKIVFLGLAALACWFLTALAAYYSAPTWFRSYPNLIAPAQTLFSILELLALALAAILIYVAPSVVAVGYKHRHAQAIIALDLLLGWTFLGWVGALVWALMAAEPVDLQRPTPPSQEEPPAALHEESDADLLGPRVLRWLGAKTAGVFTRSRSNSQ
ncbi:superinfection immunity protein [Methylocystis heyeri]|uniref:Superinfection immunity protein n=1 Tax=Methylocystis heyeri TaxID=391905 RepID=A0A6B8KGE6_9HYPH|nr:superinfection immunity protein [Methylocystis heyeri]QGM46702.1 superinfection immunity protein [Methylocystis heyeri]